jgi:DNA-3-methyladenine glycosylase
MHWAFNVVCGKVGEPQAVLVRAIEPVRGAELMAVRRGIEADRRELSNGPGKVCAALAITRDHYGSDLCGSKLFLEEGESLAPIRRSPRVNVDYAGPHAMRRWRFYEQGNRFVSVPPRD